METELSTLAGKLAEQIKAHGNKKVAVADFTDLENRPTELGKYIAEQLTVELVTTKHDFTVLDRSNTKRILEEHNLTIRGLIDPEGAKKMGQFTGVDTFIVGTVVPKGQATAVTAKIITTDTAEIIGAGKATFKADENVQKLLATPLPSTGAPAPVTEDSVKVSKTLGDLRADLLSLQVMNNFGYKLTLNLVNLSKKKSLWVAVRKGGYSGPENATLTAPNGGEAIGREVTGVPDTFFDNDRFALATEIPVGGSVPVTIKFYTGSSGQATPPGVCSIQVDFLVRYDAGYGPSRATARSMLTKMVAE